jgi:hypothetical protein
MDQPLTATLLKRNTPGSILKITDDMRIHENVTLVYGATVDGICVGGGWSNAVERCTMIYNTRITKNVTSIRAILCGWVGGQNCSNAFMIVKDLRRPSPVLN